MNIDEDTCEWLGCPTPLEMYKHHAAMLEDEISDLQLHLAKSRANIAGLVQMNDTLLIAKARAERSLKDALERISGRAKSLLRQETFALSTWLQSSATICSGRINGCWPS